MTARMSVGLPVFGTFDDAYRAVLHQILTQPDYFAATRGGPLRNEVLSAGFVLADPRQRVLYSAVRRPNIVLQYAEALWHLAGRDDLDMISYYAPRLRRLPADGVRLTGTAYGNRLFTPRGHSQWDRVIDLLRADPGSTRAALPVMRPDELRDPGDPDVARALAVQFLIRDGALHTVAFVRGQDAWNGLVSDVFSFTLIAEFTASALGVPLGTYTHLVSSMHLTAADVPGAQTVLAENAALMPNPPVMPPTGWGTLGTVLSWERHLRLNDGPLDLDAPDVAILAPYWQHVLLLLEMYRQITRREGQVSAGVLDPLPAPWRWLIAQRWPGRIPPLYVPASPRPAQGCVRRPSSAR
ncbi:thymidylate synthase [Microbispora amethystogenes]|uniref:thymidylate synthase n=1 Tax=Microbispora amethystogenes TaxID=1427754 RepID=UPI0033EB8C22